MRRLPLLIGGLAATLATGCLSTPELKGCAEYPRDTPECAEYWANRADEGAEAGPADVGPDTGRPDDAAVDEGQPADARPDAAWPADGGPIDGPLPDDATPDDAAIDAAPTDGWVDGPPDMAQGECQPGDTIACGTDVGACESGVLRCDQNGHWSEDCEAQVGPSDEICDGIDNNCDGRTDEVCECQGDASQLCGGGAGQCQPGRQRCIDGMFGPCEGEVGPTAEVCDGVDNDCDGATDDVPGVGNPCTAGLGACQRAGQLVCVAGGTPAPMCNAQPGVAGREICNGVDDDCDGAIDDNLPASPRVTPVGFSRARVGGPAVAPHIEFHGVLWIDPDDAVQFGLMTNDAFEVGPVPFERYPGGDAGGAGVALDTASELQGFAYAVSTYDVGGCAIEVGRMQQGGALIGDPARFVDGDCTPEVSVAWTGQGIGVAWTQSDPNMDQSAVAFGRTANFSVAIRGYVTVAASGRSPSLAWTGNQFGVLYISTGVVNNLEFRTIFNNQQVGNPVVITRGADHPELRYVPALGQFVAVWTEPALQGARLLKAAFLTPAGEVVQAVTLSSGRNAPVNPTLSPVENLARNAPVTRIAVTYADDGVLFTTWLLWDGRGWAWNGAAEQITGARDPTASLPKAGYASDGAGHGVAYLADSGNGRPQVRLVGGNLGCGVLPADAPR